MSKETDGWFVADVDPKMEQQLRADFQKVFFGSPEGQRVLAKILVDLGFYRENDSAPGTMELQNAARRILRNCGVWDKGNALNIVKLMAHSAKGNQ